jgi:hypothetical protein
VPCHWRWLGRTARSMVVIVIHSQSKLGDDLVEELLDVIDKYKETLDAAVVIGRLEIVKHFLIQSIGRKDDDE